MTTYISILRGINVGGQNVIRMDAVKELYADLHFVNIQTYIQSGNVVFQYHKSDRKDLELKISSQLHNKFGLEVPVIVLDEFELKDIIDKNPYKDDNTKNISHMHVTFLSSGSKLIDTEIICQKKSPEEEFLLTKNAVYLYCPNGYGKTRLTNNFFENKLKVGATTRNWKTATELLIIAEKYQE
ncbi:MAG: DUF1697 domain-containing protein [Bacteroidales bacterium]|nr:DUF1697 domain-containing protein [Bacteroidales bacterium]